ncbi:UNVERIFIED_CONTAM: hypothetical protein Sradi_5332500 [Sesamum radiatum]|uniref:Uncharacterized protein n=1 Tax=Sesamum radiatum TaxID=300843 RepID=A0AAW2LQS3_SESRA
MGRDVENGAPSLILFQKPLRFQVRRQGDGGLHGGGAAERWPCGGGALLLTGLRHLAGGGAALLAAGEGDFNLEVPLVLLAYHVDYWDYMGWKDPFGSSQWTVRQKAYVEALRLDTMFTPQIVVQGRAHCVANEEEAVLSCIRSAPRVPAPMFQASFQKPTPESLQVSLAGALRTKVDHEGANVMVALCECGLVTDCPSGANKDRVLANNYVVRRLEKLISLKDVSAKKAVSGTTTFSLWEGFNPTKCKLAVFVQNSSHQIFGSQNIPLPDKL